MREGRALLLGLCLAAFACALLHGVPRLIAGEPDAREAPRAAVVRAALTAPATAQEETRPSDGAGLGMRRGERAAQAVGLGCPVETALARDANGNPLCDRGSYLRAVYRAFTLGDGFV